MKKFVCRYPGDPPCEVLEMSREEFLDAFPRRPIEIRDLTTGEVLESRPMDADAIVCDSCNDDSKFQPVYLLARSRAYCPICYHEDLQRYCK